IRASACDEGRPYNPRGGARSWTRPARYRYGAPDSLSYRVDQSPMDLEAQFGGIDIYLFDQILRRRIGPDDRSVDAGCGVGRNLVYFLREGYEVYAADADPDCIREVRMLAARLAP